MPIYLLDYAELERRLIKIGKEHAEKANKATENRTKSYNPQVIHKNMKHCMISKIK